MIPFTTQTCMCTHMCMHAHMFCHSELLEASQERTVCIPYAVVRRMGWLMVCQDKKMVAGSSGELQVSHNSEILNSALVCTLKC